VGGLSQELNYNVMYSPRGVLMLAHNVHDVQVAKRHIHANTPTASTTNG
jgi:sarcosine oxidase subunit beta